MKLQVLPTQKFSCHSCTNCCRQFFVELMPDEVDAVAKLAWPQGDPLREVKGTRRFQGKTYLAHKPEGGCVYLNESNGRCRIHEQFGMARKPLGCRLYPFHLLATFPGTVSVTGRYDCPSIRANEGEEFAAQTGSLEKLAKEAELAAGFDAVVMDHLTRQQVEAASQFAATLLGAFSRDDEKALFLYYFCDWLSAQGIDELSRESLGACLPELQARVAETIAKPAAGLGWLGRLVFRTLLAQHLRRDEDVLDGRVGRLHRALGIAGFALGGGSLRGMALSLPPGTARQARLFRGGPAPAEGAMALHWRMIKEKLATYQFMGRGKTGRDFLSGLRALALLYPLVAAVAKSSAAGRGAQQIETRDVDAAVAAIEHGFGRSAILMNPMARWLEVMLLRPQIFVDLVRGI